MVSVLAPAPRPPISLDPLIAEAKRRMRRRRLAVAGLLLVAAAGGTALALRPAGSPGAGAHSLTSVASQRGPGSPGSTPANQPALDAAANQARKIGGTYYSGAVVNDASGTVTVYLARAPDSVVERLRALHPGVYVIRDAPRSRNAVTKLANGLDLAALEAMGIDVTVWGPTEDGHLRVGVAGHVATAQAKLDALYGKGVVRVVHAEPVRLLVSKPTSP